MTLALRAIVTAGFVLGTAALAWRWVLITRGARRLSTRAPLENASDLAQVMEAWRNEVAIYRAEARLGNVLHRWEVERSHRLLLERNAKALNAANRPRARSTSRAMAGAMSRAELQSLAEAVARLNAMVYPLQSKKAGADRVDYLLRDTNFDTPVDFKFYFDRALNHTETEVAEESEETKRGRSTDLILGEAAQ